MRPEGACALGVALSLAGCQDGDREARGTDGGRTIDASMVLMDTGVPTHDAGHTRDASAEHSDAALADAAAHDHASHDSGAPDASAPSELVGDASRVDAPDAASVADAANAVTIDGSLVDVDASDDGGSPPMDPSKVIFVTSIRYTAALGGVEGADATCMAHAVAAALPGDFRAWISTPDAPASARLAHSDIPYRRLDGEVIADNWDDLVDGDLRTALNIDEAGDTVFGDVWTGTLQDGSAYASSDCDGFTNGSTTSAALCGSASSTSSTWTENIVPTCSTPLRLYCVQQ